MKLLLLFCFVEIVSLGIIWYDVNGSKTDLQDRATAKRKLRSEKRGSRIQGSASRSSVRRTTAPAVTPEDTRLATRSLEPN